MFLFPIHFFSGGEVQAHATIPHISSADNFKNAKMVQGIGVILAEKKTTKCGESIMEAFKQTNISCCNKILSKKRGNADIRCFVMGDQVVATMQRIGQNGEVSGELPSWRKTEKLPKR